MTYKLTVDQPHLGDEGTVYIHGLGTFQNGKSYLISDELAQNFEVVNTVDEGGTNDDGVYVPKMVFGKPLDVMAESMYGITVTKNADNPPPLQPNVSVATNNDPPANTGANTNGGDQ